jgi:hypothetical protein
MISVAAGVRVLVATKPVDFRRGADSLAALAKILAWDGPGLICIGTASRKGRFAGSRSATASPTT